MPSDVLAQHGQSRLIRIAFVQRKQRRRVESTSRREDRLPLAHQGRHPQQHLPADDWPIPQWLDPPLQRLDTRLAAYPATRRYGEISLEPLAQALRWHLQNYIDSVWLRMAPGVAHPPDFPDFR